MVDRDGDRLRDVVAELVASPILPTAPVTIAFFS
jgi:hypothetical protein